MHGFAADHADDFFSAAGEDLDPLAEHHLRPPAADGHELDEAVQGDVLHHEADLVHVPGDHDARPLVAVCADHRAVLVGRQRPDVGKLVDENRPHLVLVAGYGMGFGEFLQKGECFGAHGGGLCVIGRRSAKSHVARGCISFPLFRHERAPASDFILTIRFRLRFRASRRLEPVRGGSRGRLEFQSCHAVLFREKGREAGSGSAASGKDGSAARGWSGAGDFIRIRPVRVLKKEGDGRSPAGVFDLGGVWGVHEPV